LTILYPPVTRELIDLFELMKKNENPEDIEF